jgi:hypothetical protein
MTSIGQGKLSLLSLFFSNHESDFRDIAGKSVKYFVEQNCIFEQLHCDGGFF